MNRNINIIVDSSIHNKSKDSSLYSIMSLSGTYDTIENLSSHFNKIFNGEILSEESFYNWFQVEENSKILLDFLSNINKDGSECRFTSYLSDHEFLKFTLYLNTFCPIDNDTDIIKYIDSLYQNLDKRFLDSINKDLSEKQLIDINNHVLCLVNSIIPVGVRKKILSSLTPIERQFNLIQGMNKTICADLVMADYLQYSMSLVRAINESTIASIYASEHSAKYLNISLNAYRNISSDCPDIQIECQELSKTKNQNGILLNNLIVVFDHVWNQLHDSDSIDKLPEKEKLLTIYLWVLFQSTYSRWMIASVDFDKIKQILEEFK